MSSLKKRLVFVLLPLALIFFWLTIMATTARTQSFDVKAWARAAAGEEWDIISRPGFGARVTLSFDDSEAWQQKGWQAGHYVDYSYTKQALAKSRASTAFLDGHMNIGSGFADVDVEGSMSVTNHSYSGSTGEPRSYSRDYIYTVAEALSTYHLTMKSPFEGVIAPILASGGGEATATASRGQASSSWEVFVSAHGHGTLLEWKDNVGSGFSLKRFFSRKKKTWNAQAITLPAGTILEIYKHARASGGEGSLSVLQGSASGDYSASAKADPFFFIPSELAGQVWLEISSGESNFIPYAFTDEDGDGLPDEWEQVFFGTLYWGADDDPDGDGSSNIEELLDSTNPASRRNPSTGEILSFLEDPDQDGLSTAEELVLGTNPEDGDTSNDGLLDGWKVSYGLDPLSDTITMQNGVAVLTGNQGLRLPVEAALAGSDPSALAYSMLTAGAPLDLEFRFLLDNLPGQGQRMHLVSQGNNQEDGFSVVVDDEGRLESTFLSLRTPPGAVQAGEWTNVTIQISPGGHRIYVDGEVMSTAPGEEEEVILAAKDLLFGALEKEGELEEGLVGKLDFIRIWLGNRSPMNINEQLVLPVLPGTPGLLWQWHFDSLDWLDGFNLAELIPENGPTLVHAENADILMPAEEADLNGNGLSNILEQGLFRDPWDSQNPAPLAPPAGLTALAENDNGGMGLVFSWQNVLPTASHVILERRQEGEDVWQEAGTTLANAPQYIDRDLEVNTLYHYRLRSFRYADGTYSDYSRPVTVWSGQGAVIEGMVFDDQNGNTLRDSSEPGIPGVTVTLKNQEGSVVVAEALTNGDGSFRFLVDEEGEYILAIGPTADGYTATTAETVRVVATKTSRVYYFGYTDRGMISGSVFRDLNGDGRKDYDPFEPGFAGVTVTLKRESDLEIIATTTSLENGSYRFRGIEPGNYIIEGAEIPTYFGPYLNQQQVTVTPVDRLVVNFPYLDLMAINTAPSDKTLNFPFDEPITITFNREIQAGINFDNISVLDDIGQPITITNKTIDGHDLILNLERDMEVTYTITATITLPVKALEDTNGNPQAQVYAFSIASPGVPASPWTWQNPWPQGNDLNDIHVFDSAKAVAVGNVGTVIRTFDGGLTWEVFPNQGRGNLKAVHFINQAKGWAVGSKGIVLQTTDGGDSWIRIPGTEFQGADLKDVFFLDENSGWMVGSDHEGKEYLLKTIDGGMTWQKYQVQTEPGSFTSLAGVYFLDEDTGWVVGSEGIYATTDGGQSWTEQGLGGNWHSIDFSPDGQTGWVSGSFPGYMWYQPYGKYVKITYAYEQTSYQQGNIANAAKSEVWFVGAVSADEAYVAGEKGAFSTTIYHTQDGGETWADRHDDLPFEGIFYPQAVGIVPDTGLPWAVGTAGALMKLNAEGTWELQSRAGNAERSHHLKAAFFLDDARGWGVGDFGVIMATVDGGGTWESQESYPLWGRTWQDVYFVDENKGMVVGTDSWVGVTADGGENWNIFRPTNWWGRDFYGLWLFGDNVGIAVTEDGIYKTSNGGQTWLSRGIYGDMRALDFVDENRGWAVGKDGAVYMTVDGGESWSQQSIPAGAEDFDFYEVTFVDLQYGWVLGRKYDMDTYQENSILLKTSDGGDSWSIGMELEGTSLRDVRFTDRDNGWAVGDFRGIFRTTDGGTSWVEYLTSDKIAALYFPSNDQGWAVGGGAAVLNWGDKKPVVSDDYSDDLNPDANGPVRTIAVQADGKILVGGVFTEIGGETRNRIARLNADGTLDPDFNPNANGPVRSIAVQADGKVLVGGNFTSISWQERNSLARLNTDGSIDPTFNPGPNSDVHTLAIQPDGKILVGGDFSAIAGGLRYRLARLNADGTLDTGFNPNADSSVYTLAVQPDGKILAGGSFTSIAGIPQNYIARLNPDGTLDTSFYPDSNDNVFTLAVQADGKILIGGKFTSIDTEVRHRIARLHADGSLDDGFNPDANGDIFTLAVQTDGSVLVGGTFTSMGGEEGNRIVRLHHDGTLDTFFNPNADTRVYALAVQRDGLVLVGGDFTHIGGAWRNHIARLVHSSEASNNLEVALDGTEVTWLRGGSSPEVDWVTFEISQDATSWTLLGSVNRVEGGWRLTGLDLPQGETGYIRARGYYSTGSYNGSASIHESVQQFYLPGPQTHTVTLTSDPPAGGSPTGGGTFTHGTEISVSAGTVAGYTFSGWYDGEAQLSELPVYTFTVEEDITLTARFILDDPVIDPPEFFSYTLADNEWNGHPDFMDITGASLDSDGYNFVFTFHLRNIPEVMALDSGGYYRWGMQIGRGANIYDQNKVLSFFETANTTAGNPAHVQGWGAAAVSADSEANTVTISGTFSEQLDPESIWYIFAYTTYVEGYDDFNNEIVAGDPAVLMIPGTPKDLELEVVSASQINLVWVDERHPWSDNETSFEIERKEDGGDWSQVASITSLASSISYSDTDLAAGTSYSYRVRGYNGLGQSNYSNVVGAVTTETDLSEFTVVLALPGEKTANEAFDLSITGTRGIDGDDLNGEINITVDTDLDGVVYTGIATFSGGDAMVNITLITVGEHTLTVNVDGVTGNEILSAVVLYSDTETVYGDVDSDGYITVTDAILVLRHLVGTINLEEQYSSAGVTRADVNGNGKVDIGDAILILRYIVGIIHQFPIDSTFIA